MEREQVVKVQVDMMRELQTLFANRAENSDNLLEGIQALVKSAYCAGVIGGIGLSNDNNEVQVEAANMQENLCALAVKLDDKVTELMEFNE